MFLKNCTDLEYKIKKCILLFIGVMSLKKMYETISINNKGFDKCWFLSNRYT